MQKRGTFPCFGLHFSRLYLKIATGDKMEKKVNLTSVQIFEKIFPNAQQGYDSDEVDLMLDAIIEDYQYFEGLSGEMAKLQEKITDVTLNNNELLEQNENYSRQVRQANEQKAAAENRVVEVVRQNEDAHNSDVARVEAMNLEVATLKERIAELEEKLAEQVTPQAYNQLEVLKRIARIEQKVFGKD